jgi:hypothetical protein
MNSKMNSKKTNIFLKKIPTLDSPSNLTSIQESVLIKIENLLNSTQILKPILAVVIVNIKLHSFHWKVLIIKKIFQKKKTKLNQPMKINSVVNYKKKKYK